MITMDDKVMRNYETAYRNIDGEGLIMNPKDSMLHSLNETACAIWEFISEKRKISDIVEIVMGEFDIGRKTAEKDVLECIKTFQQQDLVKIISSHEKSEQS